jgi:parallel beta-helix repeat protein
LIIVAVIGVSLYLVASSGMFAKSTTTTAYTTTVVQQNVNSFSGCANITKSGTYYLSKSAKSTIMHGACINITASNVDIICNNNQLVGSGPFVGVPPFSYAILVRNANNVSVTGCTLKNFSYGIFAASVNSLRVSNSNISVNYMSNIYLGNVHNGTLSNNYLSKTSSIQGSLYLTNGTSGTTIINNTVRYNQYYGVNVNASNNTFRNNLVNGTQYSFSCSTPNGFVVSSKAYSNLCYNNTGCGFIQCRGINIPANISKITLSGAVSSCGTITSPGYYQLSSNVNMKNFVNTSNPLSVLNPCINVRAKNVAINCNGFGVTNATTAIYANGRNNLTITNCKVMNAIAGGIVLYNVTQAHLSNIILVNDSIGIQLYNSSISTFYNISASRNLYGLYLTGSYANNFQLLNFSRNNYGIFLQSSSLSNNFGKSSILNSSSMDVYASPDSANATLNLMQTSVCGLTNAVWAGCKHFVYTSLPYVPVSSCGSISAPGNYLVTTSILNAQPQCMMITSSNVHFSCGGHMIASGLAPGVGTGISIANVKNVSILDCSISLFTYAVNASNSARVSISGFNVQGGEYGVMFRGVTYGSVTNGIINGTANAGILLLNSGSVSVVNNSASDGLMQSVGILVNGSSNNIILNNTAVSEYVGLQFSGRSFNNTVLNNSMSGSTYTDFLCSPGTSALNAELGGTNYGTGKVGCHWLAALPKVNPAVECSLSQQPNYIQLEQDSEYLFGSTCFTLNANTTIVNCNGHTVIALNGGTFASFRNSRRSGIWDCYLKGFTTPIVAVNSSLTVFNNSFLQNAGSGFAINLSNAKNGGLSVNLNNITAAGGPGIRIANSVGGSLLNNLVGGASVSYLLSNDVAFTITNNTASQNANGGMLLMNSTQNQFRSNFFLSGMRGLQCTGSSGAAGNNTDLGQNSCSSLLNCSWIKGSISAC